MGDTNKKNITNTKTLKSQQNSIKLGKHRSLIKHTVGLRIVHHYTQQWSQVFPFKQHNILITWCTLIISLKVCVSTVGTYHQELSKETWLRQSSLWMCSNNAARFWLSPFFTQCPYILNVQLSMSLRKFLTPYGLVLIVSTGIGGGL